MGKSSIDWCDYSSNIYTGCQHPCRKNYCYAARMVGNIGLKGDGKLHALIQLPNKKIVDTMSPADIRDNAGNHVYDEVDKRNPYPYGFDPTIRYYQLNDLENLKKPQAIFMVSMGDLFGKWVPEQWIKDIFGACDRSPMHTYLFLTKAPSRYVELNARTGWFRNLALTRDCYFGTTITGENGENDRKRQLMLNSLPQNVKLFLSIEPIIGPVSTIPFPRGTTFILGKQSDKSTMKDEWLIKTRESIRENNPGGLIFIKEKTIPDYERIFEAEAPRDLAWKVHKKLR